MPSFSLRAIFLIVAVAALGAAAIVNANEWWTIAVTTATVLALVAATISAGRPFYRGFCVMGWAYFLLTTGPTAVGMDVRLLPTRILRKALPFADESIQGISPAYLAVGWAMEGQNRTSLNAEEIPDWLQLHRFQVAQCLLAFVFGAVAGFVTQTVVARQARGARDDAKRPSEGAGQTG